MPRVGQSRRNHFVFERLIGGANRILITRSIQLQPYLSHEHGQLRSTDWLSLLCCSSKRMNLGGKSCLAYVYAFNMIIDASDGGCEF